MMITSCENCEDSRLIVENLKENVSSLRKMLKKKNQIIKKLRKMGGSSE